MPMYPIPPDFRSSFQFRLFSLFTLLTAAMTVFLVALYVLTELRENRTYAADKLQLQAQALAEGIRQPLYAENHETLVAAAEEALGFPHICCVEISAADGRVLVKLPDTSHCSEAGCISKIGEVRASAVISLPFPGLKSGHEVPISRIGYVRLYRSTDDITRAARMLMVRASVLAALFWLLVSFSCYRLLLRVTRSFQGLMQGLERVHAGDYSTRIEILADDEPGRAAVAVNELAEALGRRVEENARLNAELRTAVGLEVAANERLISVNRSLEEEVAEHSRTRQGFKDLVEQLPVGIVLSDNAGAIQYRNSFMLERFGYGQDEYRTVEEWFGCVLPDPAYRDEIVRKRRSSIAAWQSGGTKRSCCDIKAVCRDGSVRDLFMSIQLSGAGVIDIMTDMTEREQLQQQTIRVQKLESIGVLAGGIAHNFNNALTGVMGFISIARSLLDRSHRSYDLLQDAENASRRAAGIARQLMTFAKRGDPLRGAVSVEKVLNEALLLATSGSRVVSRLVLAPALHPLYADESQISQAFSCICINAVQAMPAGGVLAVRARNVSSDHENLPVPARGCYVEISFEDQGCGIPEEHRAKIFTPYFTTKADIGTGLGLATVHSIVTRHGGAITFVSRAGEGTTFTLYLPAIKQPGPRPAPDEDAEAAPVGAAGQSILVLDDEEMIRDFVHQALEEHGYRVTSCASGEEAASLYREAYASGTPYLAAILDLTVPGGMGGKEVAQLIVALDPDARLIVSSGYSDDLIVKNYRKYGFCGVAVKPYSAHDLLRLLQHLGG